MPEHIDPAVLAAAMNEHYERDGHPAPAYSIERCAANIAAAYERIAASTELSRIGSRLRVGD